MGNAHGCIALKREYDLYYLNKVNKDNIPLFNLNGYKTYAKVVDVYDGDTCTIIFSWEKKLRKFKCRCYGYDSPEIKPRLDISDREDIIEKAKLAKNRLNELTNGIVYIECLDFDKYGRLLVNLYKNNVYINNTMIKEGHGYVYHGGKKH
jgi:endonuclease YncB( thermonuclease family)